MQEFQKKRSYSSPAKENKCKNVPDVISKKGADK